jgi:putative acetyltransferase
MCQEWKAMLIRHETPADVDVIHDLTSTAFQPMPYSDGTEADIIRALRASGELAISLVAEEDGAILGHVAFSPVAIDGAHDGWFGLGPISVRADRQRQGIGRSLIERGLALLRERGAAGCALIGNPEIYGRVGFSGGGELSYGSLDRKYVQWIAFDRSAPRGMLTFAPAFENQG